MKFKQNTRRPPIEYEKDLVKQWKKNKTFEKSVAMRPKDNSFVFYDGPPFITGLPHTGTLLVSIIKDAVPRYHTMKGKHVERRWGWDCHGLPAEVFTEKKLGIKDKRDIGTKISLEDYIVACRNNMIQTGSLWEDTIERVGRWVDFKGAYKTMDKDYMESVWWAFKKLYEAGKIYEGERVLLYCTRDATPLSKAEVAMDNSYQDDTDPSVYAKFRIFDDEYTSYLLRAYENAEDEPEMSEAEKQQIYQKIEEKSPKTYLLAWTTTPWTLNANTAIAINKDIDYVKVEVNGERLILAKKSLDRVLRDEKHHVLPYKIIKIFKGEALRDFKYEPLFADRGEGAHYIWHADFVTDEEGTGIAHEAPAYGEDDYNFSKEHNIPLLLDTDEEGFYTEGEWKGRQIWDVNKEIAKTLHERGVVWKIEYITHSYPHCFRCHTKLMYRAHPSWFMNIDNQRAEMLEQNGNTYWFPDYIKNGRFAKTIENAPDWNLSRDRFWATAMPVWKGTDEKGKEHIKIIGSYAELKELSGAELEDYHRPWVDDVTFTKDGVEYQRIDKVMDCWFEAGSMPFAQFHYPFENAKKFEQNFPGDFIVEYVAQTRTWFYYLHAIGVALFNTHTFNNVIVTGTLAGNDGRKMSKQYGNYTDPNELMDTYSADALRFLLLSSPLLSGEDFSLMDKNVADVARKLAMIWNMYDFFSLYADVGRWEWNGDLADPMTHLINPLDQWIVSRLHQLTQHVDKHMQDYNVPEALADVLPFIDDASNWYVRRSRKRFWRPAHRSLGEGGNDNAQDKNDAFRTLHYVLVQLAIVMAPFTPFLSEELYQKLTGGESVHLLDWPEAGHVNEIVLQAMTTVREVITQGLAERAQAGLKVRQPLQSMTLRGVPEFESALIEIIREELNVKEVKVVPSKTAITPKIELDTRVTENLQQEGLAREVVRHIQSARKQAGLRVDEQVHLGLETSSKSLASAITEYTELIQLETLAADVSLKGAADYASTVTIEDHPLSISLKKVD